MSTRLFYNSRRSPVRGMSRTHRFTTADTAIDPVVEFGDRLQPMTCRAVFSITGASPSGVIVEMGGVARGLLIAIGGVDDYGFQVGDASAGFNNLGVVADSGIGAGESYEFVVSWVPGLGKAVAWFDGREVLRGYCAGGSYGGEWAGTGLGAVGDDNGAVMPGLGISGPLTDAEVAFVEFYEGQVPREFH